MHENAATLETAEGTAARVDTLGNGNTVQVEADRIVSAEEEGEARMVSVQARGVSTAVSQVSLIPLPAKQVSPAVPVKKVSIRVATAHAKSS